MLNSLVIPPCCSRCNPDVSCPLIFLFELPPPSSTHINASVSPWHLPRVPWGRWGEDQHCILLSHPLKYLRRPRNSFLGAFLLSLHLESLFLSPPHIPRAVGFNLPLSASASDLKSLPCPYAVFDSLLYLMPSYLLLFAAR